VAPSFVVLQRGALACAAHAVWLGSHTRASSDRAGTTCPVRRPAGVPTRRHWWVGFSSGTHHVDAHAQAVPHAPARHSADARTVDARPHLWPRSHSLWSKPWPHVADAERRAHLYPAGH